VGTCRLQRREETEKWHAAARPAGAGAHYGETAQQRCGAIAKAVGTRTIAASEG